MRRSTQGDWVAWVGVYEDLALGREGQYQVRLKDNHVGADFAYPGVEVLPDGTFVVTTYGHWAPGEAPYILSVRLKLQELDAMAGKKLTPPFPRHRRFFDSEEQTTNCTNVVQEMHQTV